MSITDIEIRNVKGIDHKLFKIQLIPNKPNLLVAPNGFGKSSITTAFASMNAKRIDLAEKDHHKEDTARQPELVITFNGAKLTADSTKNEIRKQFDVTVIRSDLEAKATKRNMGRFTQVTASLEVKSIPICKIPEKTSFNYRPAHIKTIFGANSKILPNISALLQNPLLVETIESCDLSKMTGIRIQQTLKGIIDTINQQAGTSEQIYQWMTDNFLESFRTIQPLNDFSQKLLQLDLIESETEAFLIAYQVASIYTADQKVFNLAIEWLRYTKVKMHYEDLLSDFCSSNWQWANTAEDKKAATLSVIFPKAHQLSNGQRDLLTLVIKMHKALHKGSKKPLILIIDEVFDYLDDANLVAFQYYVTSLIDTYRLNSLTIYPIILTHLDPGVFFDFCFNKHKIQINYLQAQSSGKAKKTLKFIEARDNQEIIKDRLEKCWFHFHTEADEIGSAEWPNNLPNEWRKSQTFHEYTNEELGRYLNNQNYDPLAICFAIRIGIEKLAYALLQQEDHKHQFLNEVRKTRNKIDFVVSHGVDLPEIYFLLGIIYNTNLHWTQGRDYISPLTSKLNHPIIKKLIATISNQNVEQ